MAITYKFYCSECKYKEELFIGTTMRENRDRKPEIELASCPNCLKLVGTKNKKCPICDLGINNQFQSKEKDLKIIDTRKTPMSIDCPRCGNENIKAMPILFSD